jgi:hypothetical protein
VLATDAAHQRQVRDVGRRDDHDERRRAHQQPDGEPGALAEDFLERLDADAEVGARIIGIPMIVLDAGADAGDLRPRLVDGRVRSEAGDHLGHPVRTSLHHQCARVMLADHHVEQSVHPVREVRRRLHHADDRHLPAVDDHFPADDAGVPVEPRLPVLVGEHHHRGRLGAVVVLVEQPSEHRRQSHDLEEVPGHEPDVHRHRVLLSAKGVRHPGVFGDAAERPGALAEVENLGDREQDVLAAGTVDRLPQIDQPVSIAMRKRPQENAADDAEDRRVGANAESEGQDHGQHEAGGAGETANGVAEVRNDHGESLLWG